MNKLLKYNNFLNESKVDIQFKDFIKKYNFHNNELSKLNKEYHDEILEIIISILDRYKQGYDIDDIESDDISSDIYLNNTEYISALTYEFNVWMYYGISNYGYGQSDIDGEIKQLSTFKLYNLLQGIYKNNKIMKPYTSSILKSINK